MSWTKKQTFLFAAFIVITGGTALQQSTEERTGANPIRKVVTMLQNMQKQVEEEGEREKKTL